MTTSTSTNELLRELIEEIRISRKVQLLSDILIALQKHAERNIAIMPTVEKIDAMYLNPMELYALCVNNRYIEDEGNGFFTGSAKFAKEHFNIERYPEIKKLSEREESNEQQ